MFSDVTDWESTEFSERDVELVSETGDCRGGVRVKVGTWPKNQAFDFFHIWRQLDERN